MITDVFGEIAWLLAQSPRHQTISVTDLSWLVLAPLRLEQCRMFYADSAPAGAALWAYVNEEVDRRLMQGNTRLDASEWKSGPILWLIDIIAPFGSADQMLKDLKDSVFRDAKVKLWGVKDNIASVCYLDELL